MKFYTLLKIILNTSFAIGDQLEPYLVIDAINTAAGITLINYENFNLYKDKETAKNWFNMLIMKYYNYEVLNDRDLINSSVFVNKIMEIFSKYEFLYDKYKTLINLYSDNELINKISNDSQTITTNNKNISYLMPQIKDVEHDTPNNKNIGENTQKTTYNNNYINKLTNINKNYIKVMEDFINEFSSFFFINEGYY